MALISGLRYVMGMSKVFIHEVGNSYGYKAVKVQEFTGSGIESA